MRNVDIIKQMVGMCCTDEGVYELLEPIRLTRTDIKRRPKYVAAEITAYLDDLVNNP